MNIVQKNLQLKCLEQVRAQIDKNMEIISFDSWLYLTKTQPGFGSVSLKRDFIIEKQVLNYLLPNKSQRGVFSRYNQYKLSVYSPTLPRHYPTRILTSTGVLALKENIFIFFPAAFGIKGYNAEEVFGFEFVDIWEEFFTKIGLPCIKSIGDQNFKQFIYSKLCTRNFVVTVQIAAILHEYGHQFGPWRVIPTYDKQFKISTFQRKVLGELATDSMLIESTFDSPEVMSFVLISRIFWFGRVKGSELELNIALNQNNDLWISVFLWMRLIDDNIISFVNDTLSCDFKKISQAFQKILDELYALAITLKKTNLDQHQTIVETWMKIHVPYRENDGFYIPKSYFLLLHKLKSVPYNL